MLLSYIKIAFRNLYKNKYFSIINILGLSVGLACFILIALFIQSEALFDSNHKNGNNICRIILERRSPGGPSYITAAPPPLAKTLPEECPQIISAARFINIDNPTPLISYNGRKFYESKFFFADPDIFKIFTIPVTAGNAGVIFNKPYSAAVTERTAKKYFGEE
ncbi:MAG TPA: ABC transporter permease, partial [Ignavibacteriales bacterium]|nr:ABC transporter permease [Ignavibacteriales bacterium]